MKLSEVLQAVRLIKSANPGIQFHKHQPSPTSPPVTYMDMIPGVVSHQSPYGHLLLHPHYGHRGPLSGVASIGHGIRLGGTGASASGVYGGHSAPVYQPTGYGGHMGVPSGGHPAPAGYDYHAATGPHAPVVDTAAPIHHSTGKSKTSGSSTITALTLLSFLFFLNILQGCLKEHMDTMNPTVMVMTAGVARTRVSKLAEMNSREQQHSISPSLPQSGLTMNRGGAPVADAITIIGDQVPFNAGITKIEYSNGNQRPDPAPEYYSSYPNRTMTLVDNNYQDRYHHPYRHYQHLPGTFSSPSSSAAVSSSSSSSSASSTSSSGSNSESNNYYPDTMDPYYMRIN